MGLTFFMYDRFVRHRNTKIVYVAARSNAIISSMFPTEVRDRLFFERDEKNAGRNNNGQKASIQSKLASEQHSNEESHTKNDGKPIADLFLETTILFADIVGFTAWSSVREPSQVFILLETIFQAFDDIARKRRVFKVETVGDCYVAVAGLPQPRADHAIAMARFANDCMVKMLALVKKLELTLGPDTGDLSMRMGLHSGPVTAGVLRGDRSRFQLFGDTMNTAARMEHTGHRGKIQLSQETAALLTAAGKISWLSARGDGTFERLPIYFVSRPHDLPD
jgi:class 3 adenylate cyclase